MVGDRSACGGANSRGGSFHDHEGRNQYQAIDSAGAGPRRAAPAMAIERERPLDPDQSTIMTISIATRAVGRAVYGATAPAALAVRRPGLRGNLVVTHAAKTLAISRHDHRALEPGNASAARDVRLLHAVLCHGGGLADHSGQRGRARIGWSASLARATAKLSNRLALLPAPETTLKFVSVGCFLVLWAPSAVLGIDPGFPRLPAGRRVAGCERPAR